MPEKRLRMLSIRWRGLIIPLYHSSQILASGTVLASAATCSVQDPEPKPVFSSRVKRPQHNERSPFFP
jgi:hypothetical protein